MANRSTYQAPDNSGNLFRIADEDRKSETWPQYEGEFNIICPHCNSPAKGWVKAWIKEGKAGKFFSLSFKHRQKQA